MHLIQEGINLYLDSEQTVYQIGSDGGLLEKPVHMEKIAIEPSERVDLIIDFSKNEGKEIVLKNDLGPNADPDNETDEVMQFRVTKPLSDFDKSVIPTRLSTIPKLKQNNISTIRNLKLVGTDDKFGRPLLLLNGKRWHDPITEKPQLGSMEIWSLFNTTAFTHPMHIHLIQFQILERQPFDLERYNQDGQIIYTGGPTPPEVNERGWKDTVAATSGHVTRVIGKYAPHVGHYVWYCHILEHEDYDMMRPFEVIDREKNN